MAENLTLTRQYARTDLVALRGYVQRIAPAVIARTYYNVDEHPHAATPAAMERYLRRQLDGLVTLAIAHGSTALAKHLRDLIKQHGHAKVSSAVYRMVEDAAQLAFAAPQGEHPVSMWFRPIIAKRLMSVQLKTLGDVVAFCNRRGGSWWRSIPRIGPGRARVLVAWLRRNSDAMGLLVEKDVDLDEPFVGGDLIEIGAEGEGASARTLAPLDRKRSVKDVYGATRPVPAWVCRVTKAAALRNRPQLTRSVMLGTAQQDSGRCQRHWPCKFQ